MCLWFVECGRSLISKQARRSISFLMFFLIVIHSLSRVLYHRYIDFLIREIIWTGQSHKSTMKTKIFTLRKTIASSIILMFYLLFSLFFLFFIAFNWTYFAWFLVQPSSQCHGNLFHTHPVSNIFLFFSLIAIISFVCLVCVCKSRK